MDKIGGNNGLYKYALYSALLKLIDEMKKYLSYCFSGICNLFCIPHCIPHIFIIFVR